MNFISIVKGNKNALLHWITHKFSTYMILLFLLFTILELSGIMIPISDEFLIFFMFCIFIHARLGLEVIIEDYVPNLFSQQLCLIGIRLLSIKLFYLFYVYYLL